ncbi:hypothetical protein E4U36_004308 [Claviceps purpurea]|nr:hypothetical protein E4U36_004308 [Claviceps purpurea]
MASSNRDIVSEPPRGVARDESVASGTAISRIESLLETVIDSISSAEPMSIPMLSRRNVQLRHDRAVPTQVSFPGRSVAEAQKFARIVFILQLAHDALVSNTTLTKRSIFYQHQELFDTQRVVDELVDNLAVTLHLDRSDLNIGIVIPPAGSIVGLNIRPIRWILVIEKDATFRSLVTSRYWERAEGGQGLLITARGYPDMATRSFLSSLSRHRPDVPIFVLADFDPDGINIFHCYLYGSGRLLPVPGAYNRSVRWLGIKSCHIESLEPFLGQPAEAHDSGRPGPSTRLSDSISSLDCQSSTPELSLRDRKTIVDTLERYTSRGDSSSINLVLRRELQVMQMLGYKAEIQLLDDSGNLECWLDYNLNIELTSHP